MDKFKEKFIGDGAFYKYVIMIALPIMIQNGVTNFVNLLDNVMVGQLGTEQMSGVAIVNQLIMVYNVCIFGEVSGASIFSSQFFGRGNHEGVRQTFRFKMIVGILITVIWLIVFGTVGGNLIILYLSEDGTGSLAEAYAAGLAYLKIIMIGLIPSCISQTYASTMREAGKTVTPMVASSVAVLTNLIGNYILIFGNFGAPALGVAGAAIATTASRFVELGILMVWTHRHTSQYSFMKGVYRTLYIPKALILQILKKGTPLLLNETLWSVGMAALTQCYSTRGLSAVAAINISSTVTQVFNVVFIALGNAIGIIVGQLLGAGKNEEAVDTDRKMIFFAIIVCAAVGAVMFFIAPLIPRIYNTSDDVRRIASDLLKIGAVFMPVYAFYNSAYFTLRSGGKTFITFLFDSCFIVVVSWPLAKALTTFTVLPVVTVYLIVQLAELLKVVIGSILLKKRVWVNNIVEDI